MVDNSFYKNCSFTCFLSSPLTNYDIQVLDTFYSVIVNEEVLQVYYGLYNYLIDGESFLRESPNISVETFILKERLELDFFVDAVKTLEGAGLIDTYQKDNKLVFVFKRVLSVDEFVLNETLFGLYRLRVNDKTMEERVYPLVLRKTSLKGYKNITHSFDESFEKDSLSKLLNKEVPSFNNNGIIIKNANFPIEQFQMLLNNKLPEGIKIDSCIFNLVERLAFLYALTPQEMVEATIYALDGKSINEEYLKKKVWDIYSENQKKHEFKPIIKKDASNSKQAQLLDSLSPKDICWSKFKVALTYTEIDMFDKLMTDTGISVGMMNAIILKVVSDKDGAVPPYKYFEKVVNSMLRADVKSTDEAIKYINTPNKVKNKPKKVIATPDWYKDYNKDIKEKEATGESIEDLSDFFNPNKGK